MSKGRYTLKEDSQKLRSAISRFCRFIPSKVPCHKPFVGHQRKKKRDKIGEQDAPFLS